ncbi:MAG TPA: hypothetical protein VNZ02_15845 [Steroidobacteraceae bacterium]|jgi:hypothetical protein|nr:hypothetical protein [Steroidobacteraceae bacterium]
MRKSMMVAALIAAASTTLLIGCQEKVAPTQVAAPAAAPPTPAKPLPPTVLKPVAGISDIMATEVDPSADALWESVGTVVTRSGIKNNHPTTDKQWDALRGHAVVLIEAANLLLMDGRRVAREGVQKIEDQGTPGNLSAEQSQKVIDDNRSSFASFAAALRTVGEQMLKAIDAKNPNDLMEAGAALDEVCEGCHLKFWYPGQKIPRFPNEAPEIR